MWSSQPKKPHPIGSYMDGPRDYQLSEVKSERERQTPYDITYMWNLNYDTNQLIYEIDSQA